MIFGNIYLASSKYEVAIKKMGNDLRLLGIYICSGHKCAQIQNAMLLGMKASQLKLSFSGSMINKKSLDSNLVSHITLLQGQILLTKII